MQKRVRSDLLLLSTFVKVIYPLVCTLTLVTKAEASSISVILNKGLLVSNAASRV